MNRAEKQNRNEVVKHVPYGVRALSRSIVSISTMISVDASLSQAIHCQVCPYRGAFLGRYVHIQRRGEYRPSALHLQEPVLRVPVRFYDVSLIAIAIVLALRDGFAMKISARRASVSVHMPYLIPRYRWRLQCPKRQPDT